VNLTLAGRGATIEPLESQWPSAGLQIISGKAGFPFQIAGATAASIPATMYSSVSPVPMAR
jgi:hypothetical protein